MAVQTFKDIRQPLFYDIRRDENEAANVGLEDKSAKPPRFVDRLSRPTGKVFDGAWCSTASSARSISKECTAAFSVL